VFPKYFYEVIFIAKRSLKLLFYKIRYDYSIMSKGENKNEKQI